MYLGRPTEGKRTEEGWDRGKGGDEENREMEGGKGRNKRGI